MSTLNHDILKFLGSLSELELQSTIIEPLLRKMDYKYVRNTSGANDKGKDLVAVKFEFGRPKLYAIQIKKLKLSGKHSNPNSLTNVLVQYRQAMKEEVIDPVNNTKRRPDRFLLISPYPISRDAMESALFQLRETEHLGDATVIDGPLLADEVSKHLPDILDKFNMETQYRHRASIESNTIKEGPAIGIDSNITVEIIYVELCVGLRNVEPSHLESLLNSEPNTRGSNLISVDPLETKMFAELGLLWEVGSPVIERIKESTQPKLGDNKKEKPKFYLNVDAIINIIHGKVIHSINAFWNLSDPTLSVDQVDTLISKIIKTIGNYTQFRNTEFFSKHIINLGKSQDIQPVSNIKKIKFIKSSFLRNTRHNLFVTGGAGAGKTTLLRWLFRAAVQEGGSKLPIFLPLLKVTVTTEQAIVTLLAAQLRNLGYNIDDQDFLDKATNGNFRFFLDGLDECGSRANDTMNTIVLLARQWHRCQFVVSCRDNFTYPTWDESLIVRLNFFDTNDVFTFINKWFYSEPSSVAGLISWLERNPEMLEEAKTPLICALLCSLYQAHGDLPSTRIDLYEQRTSLLLGRWEQVKGIQPLPPDLRQRYIFCLSHLGLEAHKAELRKFEISLAYKIIKKYYSKKFHESPDAMLSDLVYRGLLYQDPNSLLNFGHLTYQEHFAARWLARESNAEFVWSKITIPWWSKVLEFYAQTRGDISELIFLGMSHKKLPRSQYDTMMRLIKLSKFTPEETAYKFERKFKE